MGRRWDKVLMIRRIYRDRDTGQVREGYEYSYRDYDMEHVFIDNLRREFDLGPIGALELTWVQGPKRKPTDRASSVTRKSEGADG